MNSLRAGNDKRLSTVRKTRNSAALTYGNLNLPPNVQVKRLSKNSAAFTCQLYKEDETRAVSKVAKSTELNSIEAGHCRQKGSSVLASFTTYSEQPITFSVTRIPGPKEPFIKYCEFSKAYRTVIQSETAIFSIQPYLGDQNIDESSSEIMEETNEAGTSLTRFVPFSDNLDAPVEPSGAIQTPPASSFTSNKNDTPNFDFNQVVENPQLPMITECNVSKDSATTSSACCETQVRNLEKTASEFLGAAGVSSLPSSEPSASIMDIKPLDLTISSDACVSNSSKSFLDWKNIISSTENASASTDCFVFEGKEEPSEKTDEKEHIFNFVFNSDGDLKSIISPIVVTPSTLKGPEESSSDENGKKENRKAVTQQKIIALNPVSDESNTEGVSHSSNSNVRDFVAENSNVNRPDMVLETKRQVPSVQSAAAEVPISSSDQQPVAQQNNTVQTLQNSEILESAGHLEPQPNKPFTQVMAVSGKLRSKPSSLALTSMHPNMSPVAPVSASGPIANENSRTTRTVPSLQNNPPLPSSTSQEQHREPIQPNQAQFLARQPWFYKQCRIAIIRHALQPPLNPSNLQPLSMTYQQIIRNPPTETSNLFGDSSLVGSRSTSELGSVRQSEVQKKRTLFRPTTGNRVKIFDGFGLVCKDFLYRTCVKSNCPYSHKLDSPELLKTNLKGKSQLFLYDTYDYVFSCVKLIENYFKTMCELFAERQFRCKLISMISDLSRSESGHLPIYLKYIQCALMKTGLKRRDATVIIIQKYHFRNYRMVDVVVDMILEAFLDDPLQFIPELKKIDELPKYKFGLNSLIKLSNICVEYMLLDLVKVLISALARFDTMPEKYDLFYTPAIRNFVITVRKVEIALNINLLKAGGLKASAYIDLPTGSQLY